MRIIDIAATLGAKPTRRRCFREPNELLSFMNSYGLTDAVAWHTLAGGDPVAGNRLMDEIATANPRIRAAHFVDAPDCAEPIERRLKAQRPAAVRLLPNAQNLILDPFYCGELFEVLDALHMPVILPQDEFNYRDLPTLLGTFKRVKLILLRQGFRSSRMIFPLMEKAENVYFDTSNMVDTGLLDQLVARFGADRLLFASGLPEYEPSGALGLVAYARISDGDKQKIFADNWLRVEGEIAWPR